MNNSPFKFLDSYTKEDKDIFFGRESEIEKLYSLVFESKTLLVYGVSGTGKSSLIHCGLANKFNEADWLPINIRRGSDMMESFWMALEKTALTPLKKPEKLTAGKFKKTIQSIYLDHFKPIFFIFDQFEELFVFGSEEEQKEFLAIIKSITESDLQTRFVFVIREEYLAWFTEFESDIPTILDNRLRIEKMTRENARQAIEGPSQLVNIEVEEDFSQTLLQKLSPNQNQVELTYLQVYLDKLYRMAQEEIGEDGQLQFTKKLIDQSGNISDLLGSFLEEQIAQLEDPNAGLKVLKSFVSTKGTKRQINTQEAQNYIKTLGADLSQEQISQLITQFINLRILRDKDEADRYELRHDALAAKIFEKITLAEKELLEIRQFIEHAFDNYQKRDILLSQEDLDYVQPFLEKLHLPANLMGFIEESNQINLENARKQKNLSRWSLWVLLLVISIVMSPAVYLGGYLIQSNKGEQAMFNKEVAPVKSLMKSIKVLEKHNLSNAKKSMLDSFLEVCRHLDRIDTLKRENGKEWSDFSIVETDREIIKMGKVSNSSLYYTLDSSLNIQIWDNDFIIRDNYQLSTFPQEIKFSNSGEILAFLDSDTSLYLYLKGKQFFKKKIIAPKDLLKKFFALSPNGNYLCFLDHGNVFYYHINTQELNQFETGSHLIKVLDYSNENNICAFLSTDSTIMTYKMDKDSVFLFSDFSIQSPNDNIYKDIELTNDAKYILVNSNLWNAYNIINIYKINGDTPESGKYVEEYGRGMGNYLADIEVVNDTGIIYYYTRGIVKPESGIINMPRKIQTSFSINHLYQNDLTYKLLKYTQRPIIYMEAANDFKRFVIQYHTNEFELINDGISIQTFKYPYIMFSHDETKIIGFEKNKIYSFPISIASIQDYFQPYSLKNLRHIDPSGLH